MHGTFKGLANAFPAAGFQPGGSRFQRALGLGNLPSIQSSHSLALLDPFSGTCEVSRASRPPVTGPRRLRGAQGVPFDHCNGYRSRDQTSTEFGRSEAPNRALSRVKHGSEGASRRHGFRAAVAILRWREMELRAFSPHPSYLLAQAAFSQHPA